MGTTEQNARHYATLTNEVKMFRAAKARAMKRGIAFTITLDDIIIPSHCPVLGMALVKGIKKHRDCSPSLDRIKPELGYVPGNIIVMSRRANRIKTDGTLEEHRRMVTFLTAILAEW